MIAKKLASATALRGPTPNCKSCSFRLEKLSSFFLELNFFSGGFPFVFQLIFFFKKLSSFFLELNFFLDDFLLFLN